MAASEAATNRSTSTPAGSGGCHRSVALVTFEARVERVSPAEGVEERRRFVRA